MAVDTQKRMRKGSFMNRLQMYLFIIWVSLSCVSFFIEGVACNPGSSDDFYVLLGVQRQSQKADIKKAYRTLSKKYHPDKNPGDESAADHYKKINRAYEVLSDDDKRQVYDNGGIDGLERFEQGQGQIQKGPNARADVSVTLEDLYKGTQRKMNINRNIYCPQCRGSGAKDGKLKQCQKCKGRGHVMQNVQVGFGMQMQMQQACPKCGGKGQTMAAKCAHCVGRRLVNDNKLIDLTIEKGMANGETIILEKEAEQVPDLAKGDLIFTVRQKKHSKFSRVGDNLYMDLPISLEESLLGFKKTIVHLDGHTFEVKSNQDQIIQPDEWIIIKGQGMPKRNIPSEFGDMHVKMKVALPKTLSKKQQEILKKIFPANA